MVVDIKRVPKSLERALLVIMLILGCTSCATVDIVRFTHETFPPKQAGEVEVLGKPPPVPYEKVAQLTIADSTKKLYTLQRMIMKKATSMGADAVIFSDPEAHYEHKVTYAPVYRPWGYYSPYYGYGGSYMSAIPTSSNVRRNTLSGIAIKYTGDTNP